MQVANPAIGWLYLGDSERRLARDIMAALKGKQTLDEMGLGPMRGAFANRFFPGVVSGMTRARYLVFLPSLLQGVENALRKGAAFDPKTEVISLL